MSEQDLKAILGKLQYRDDAKVVQQITEQMKQVQARMAGVRHKLAGIADATISMEGIYDPASGKAGSLLFVLAHGTATQSTSYVYAPQGTASGKPKLSGECFLASASLPSGLDDAVTFSAELQNSGTVTVGTY